MSTPAYVTLTGPQTTVLIVSFSVASGAGVGSTVTGTIQVTPTWSGQTIQVPITEVWSIIDMYTVGSVSPDAQVMLYINGFQQSIMPNLNMLNAQLYTRWRLQEALKIPPASNFSFQIALLGASASAQTYYLYVKIVRAPFAGTGAKR